MRITRAALRAQVSEDALRDQLDLHLKVQAGTLSGSGNGNGNDILIHEDSDKENSMVSESEAKSLESQQSDRKALSDITDQTYPNAQMAETQYTREPATKKIKQARGKGSKEKRQAADNESKLEDAPSTVTAADISSDTLADAQHAAESPTSTVDEASVSVSLPGHGMSISSLSARVSTIKPLSPQATPVSASKPLLFDPETHVSSENGSLSNSSVSQDSFVEDIKSRSPSKHHTPVKENTDSFIGDITSRTPARSISSPRVEDSVAALDALEEAIEKIAEDLPALEPAPAASPTKKTSTANKSALKVTIKGHSRAPSKPLSPVKNKMMNAGSDPLAGKLSVKDRIKAFETKPAMPSHRRANSVANVKPVSAPVVKIMKKPSHAPSKSVVVVPSKPMVSPTQSPAKPLQNMVKKRVPSGPLSTSKPGFVPAKSTKPLTKSAFVLPGDAIAAKLKAQREERTKKEEEAANKKKEFKARPVPVKTARPSVVPRENKTSQARLKRMSGENKENVEPARSAATPKITLTTAKTRPGAIQPNSSVRRTSPSSSSTNASAKPNSTAMRVTSSDSTTSQSSQASTVKAAPPRGKEAFERQRMTITDAHREKREKEEAAKKARAEAAERGRQASREWAEKQKRKLMTDKENKAKAQEQAIVA